MDEAAVVRWLGDYVAAWESYDAAAIGELFSDDAVYRWHPWNEDAVYRYHPWDEDEKAVRGRDAIVASWLDERDTPGSWSAEYAPWAVDGERAVAVGMSRYLTEDRSAVARVYHNVFLLRFDGDGRCSEFTEFFMRRSD